MAAVLDPMLSNPAFNFHLPWEHPMEPCCRQINHDTAEQLELAESRCSAPNVYEAVIQPTIQPTHNLFPRLAKSHSRNPNLLKGQRKIAKDIIRNGPLLTPDQLQAFDTLNTQVEAIRDDSGFRSKYGFIDFDRVAFLNEIPAVITMLVMYNVGSPLISLLSPICGALLAYIVLLVRGNQISFSSFVSVLSQRFKWLLDINKLFDSSYSLYNRVKVVLTAGLYCFSIYANIRSCRNFIRNYSIVGTTLQALTTATHALSSCIHRLSKLAVSTHTPQLKAYWEWVGLATAPARQIVSQIESYLPLRARNPTSIPLALRLFYQLKHSPHMHISLNWLLGIGGLCEVYQGIARGWKNKELGVCLSTTSFENAFVRDLRHPTLRKHCVTNTVKLQRSAVLTGRNGSGKTTLAKSLAIAAILGHQFGLAPCAKAQLPPLSTIRCEMNVPDTNERDSLFEAEGRRCLELVNELKAEPTGFHLCVFDELFSGTNANEALEAAIGVLNNMVANGRTRFMVTTHMHALGPRLGEELTQSLTMGVDDDGQPTHEAEPGVADSSGAHDTLVRIGFTAEQLGDGG
jgi:hypothetical protein